MTPFFCPRNNPKSLPADKVGGGKNVQKFDYVFYRCPMCWITVYFLNRFSFLVNFIGQILHRILMRFTMLYPTYIYVESGIYSQMINSLCILHEVTAKHWLVCIRNFINLGWPIDRKWNPQSRSHTITISVWFCRSEYYFV